MSADEALVPVECLGGPYDGHRADVALNDPQHDVYLLECGGEAHAYAWAGTSTDKGKRWVLKYVCAVGGKGMPCAL